MIEPPLGQSEKRWTESGFASLELRHLAALRAVAEEGSFRKAAMQLGYTQPAVSQQVASLEELVGHRLISRRRGGGVMELTPYGRALLHHTYVISAQLNAAAADLAAIQQGEEGPLRIGTMQSTGAHVLPMTLKGLSPSVPPSRVVLTESSDDRTLLALLERGSIDVTFTVLPFEEQGPFQTVELLQDPFVAVVPADHVLPTGRLSPKVAETGRITIEALAALPLIAYDHARSGVRADLILERHGYLPRVVLRTDDNATAQGLAAEGLGVALVPWLTITPSSSVSLLAVDPPLPPRRIGITWNSSRHKSPLIGHFVEAAMVAACSLTTEIAAAFRARPPRLRQAASGATDAVRRGRSSAVRSS